MPLPLLVGHNSYLHVFMPLPLLVGAWPIKFTEWSKSGKKHPLPIDLSTENKKAKRSAYEKERRPGRSFNRKWKDKMNKQMTT